MCDIEQAYQQGLMLKTALPNKVDYAVAEVVSIIGSGTKTADYWRGLFDAILLVRHSWASTDESVRLDLPTILTGLQAVCALISKEDDVEEWPEEIEQSDFDIHSH